MRVLHLLDTVNRGGAETLVLDVCRNAAARDIDLTFVTTQGGALEADFRDSGAAFFRLQRRLPIEPLAIWKIRKIIKERNIEVVHAHQAVDGLMLYLATVNLPVKRVLTFHGFIADAKNLQTLRFLIPRTDANIYVSRALQNWLAQRDNLDVETNAHVVYNGTDEKRLRPTGANLRRELSLTDDVPLIGMIGNFYRDPRKDQLTVCRALPDIFAAVAHAQCIFVGKTESGAEHKFQQCVDFCRSAGISDQVHFLGVRDDVPDILSALDLFVFSSLQEGLPIAMTEAMLARVPLLISAIEPLLEASENGRYAETFPVGNAEVLTEKSIRLLEQKTLRKNLAEDAFEFARKKFSIESHLDSLKKLYCSLIDS